jgi:hypothetical protein
MPGGSEVRRERGVEHVVAVAFGLEDADFGDEVEVLGAGCLADVQERGELLGCCRAPGRSP